ncbi:chaperonin containing TCP1 subunit 8 [Phyllostomus discolor]|uniref:Chaperonin containing TCP1 subunit 8 n=1 Tax=Phyllostomus discolor TaxID=89673 RepID=A0A834AVD6_9CHIR|nr:chaperonin containing TCP1 subunit 8 [Phyllostomus discolor]
MRGWVSGWLRGVVLGLWCPPSVWKGLSPPPRQWLGPKVGSSLLRRPPPLPLGGVTAWGARCCGQGGRFGEIAESALQPRCQPRELTDGFAVAPQGSGICSSSVLHGMVFKKETEGDVTSVKDAKIAVYSCPFDGMITETKGTVLIKTAEELMNFSKGEENLMDAQVKAIADTGANVIVTGGKVADMALHYANKYNIMLVRLNSKWDLRRLCKTVGATALPRLTPPVVEEMGHCDSVYLSEVGDTQVVVFKHEKEDGAISTIVLRGSTDNLMDDVERAVDDGVNTFKVLTRDKRLVPGGGATEIELAKQITSYGETCPGLEQYAIKKFAEALEAIPRALAENSGVKANEVISKLYAVHQEGNKNVGLDIEAEVPAVKDMLEAGVLDTYLGKYWAIKLATNAAVTVLRVDQIIMAKPAGGPKPPSGKKDWDDDQND